MGLGLSLSYQCVVEQHKGTIDVKTIEGESTTLIIGLPKTLHAEAGNHSRSASKMSM